MSAAFRPSPWPFRRRCRRLPRALGRPRKQLSAVRLLRVFASSMLSYGVRGSRWCRLTSLPSYCSKVAPPIPILSSYVTTACLGQSPQRSAQNPPRELAQSVRLACHAAERTRPPPWQLRRRGRRSRACCSINHALLERSAQVAAASGRARRFRGVRVVVVRGQHLVAPLRKERDAQLSCGFECDSARLTSDGGG